MNELTFAALGVDMSVVAPELLLFGFVLLVMLMDMFGGRADSGVRRALPWAAFVGVLATIGLCLAQWDGPGGTFQGMAVLDRFALGTRLVVLTAAALGILLSVQYIPRINKQTGEYYALLLLSVIGMNMMGAATDLIVVFISLEVLSLALYILSGLNRSDPRSTEAAMKYFLLGAFASSFFVYGAALIYGATGSTQFTQIAAVMALGGAEANLLLAGIALLIVGFGFKVSLVPFHMWTPDVYQGAPTPVTAFMSVGTKTAAFAAFVRVLVIALNGAQPLWGGLLAVLAIVTMTVGNLAALRQVSLKRMLAYSSIAHAGYILTALVPGTVQGANGALFYLFTYAFMNIGAFAVVIALEKATGEDLVQRNLSGLGQRWPLLAGAMAVFMFSLSGIPPLAGFFGKFYVFKAAVDGGYAWLAVVGMLNSAIGAYYYLRVTVTMYFDSPDEQTASARSDWAPLNAGLAIAVIFTILIGIFPTIWTSLFESGLATVALH